MKGLSVFMLGFIPVFAVIVAASGGAVTSASMSTLLLNCGAGGLLHFKLCGAAAHGRVFGGEHRLLGISAYAKVGNSRNG